MKYGSIQAGHIRTLMEKLLGITILLLTLEKVDLLSKERAI